MSIDRKVDPGRADALAGFLSASVPTKARPLGRMAPGCRRSVGVGTVHTGTSRACGMSRPRAPSWPTGSWSCSGEGAGPVGSLPAGSPEASQYGDEAVEGRARLQDDVALQCHRLGDHDLGEAARAADVHLDYGRLVSGGFGLELHRNRPVASVDEEGQTTFLNYCRYTDVLFDIFVLIDNNFRFMWEGCSS